MDNSLTIAEGFRLAKDSRCLLTEFLPWPGPLGTALCVGGRKKGGWPAMAPSHEASLS